MYYYQIGYCYKNTDGLFEHLPIHGEVTTDKAVAEKWFDNAVRQCRERDYCYKVVSVMDKELDYMCYIKQAHIVCEEAAYLQGEYLIELNCYTHNPNL